VRGLKQEVAAKLLVRVNGLAAEVIPDDVAATADAHPDGYVLPASM